MPVFYRGGQRLRKVKQFSPVTCLINGGQRLNPSLLDAKLITQFHLPFLSPPHLAMLFPSIRYSHVVKWTLSGYEILVE
jgi:hypothetical protein